MSLRSFSSLFNKAMEYSKPFMSQETAQYKPTAYLAHPFLQSVYSLAQPKINLNLHRQRIFFEDGGHISLDWGKNPRKPSLLQETQPIIFLMHGLTGGSQMNYVKALMKQGQTQGYRTVCMNSRGINNEMTSPIPFTGMSHHELQMALSRVELYYPNSPIYMVGTSFGGNYLLRYLLKNNRPNIKGLVALAPPFNVRKAADDMPPMYQKFFVKRYIEETVKKHPQMNYWANIGLVNMKKVLQSNNLREFYNSLTVPILGLNSADEIFDLYNISADQIKQLKVPTLLMTSKDDPIVSFQSFPQQQIRKNKNIQFVTTQRGGHLCWFEGIIPKRWYPKPTLSYFQKIRGRL